MVLNSKQDNNSNLWQGMYKMYKGCTGSSTTSEINPCGYVIHVGIIHYVHYNGTTFQNHTLGTPAEKYKALLTLY